MTQTFHFVRQDSRESRTRPRYWRNVGVESDEETDVSPLDQRQRVVWIEQQDSDGGDADLVWAVKTAELTPTARPSHDSVSTTLIDTGETVEEAESLAMERFKQFATDGTLF